MSQNIEDAKSALDALVAWAYDREHDMDSGAPDSMQPNLTFGGFQIRHAVAELSKLRDAETERDALLDALLDWTHELPPAIAAHAQILRNKKGAPC